MTRPTLVELAVRVLRAAIGRARAQRIDDDGVRLALRCLLPHATDRALLVEFWTYAGQPHHLHRVDSCEQILAAIVADLRSAAAYPDADQEARRYLVDQIAIVEQDTNRKRDVARRHYFAPPRPRRA